MKCVKIRTFFEQGEKNDFTHPVVIARWCCTAGACLLGLQWEKTQQQAYLGPRSQDGSQQRSAGPAIQGRPPPCSPHFAGMYTWNFAGHSAFSAVTSPPAHSRKHGMLVLCLWPFSWFMMFDISPDGVKLSKHHVLGLDTEEFLPRLGQ